MFPQSSFQQNLITACIHGVILLIETLYNAVSYSVHSFNKSGGNSSLHWNGAQVEHHPQNTLKASYGDVEVKVLITPTSQQLE